MAESRGLNDALRDALEREPGNDDLRRHLAEQELLSGDAPAALEHCRRLLGSDPGDPGLLDLAARAAKAAGDDVAAERYAAALGPRPPAPTAPGADRGPGDSRTPPPRRARNPVAGDWDDDEDDEDDDGWLDVERSVVRLEDVGGMEQVKRRLQLSFLGPLANPELRASYGAQLRGGLLLWGPPGCGKTLIARALAGELGASFVSLGISDVLDMWVGRSEQNLREAFDHARRTSPCVVFLDELDALGQKRSQLRHSGVRTTVNQLLSELDGAERDNDGLFVLGATNHPWDVDTALRRPGRFDRSVLVLPPDEPARAAILHGALASRPTAKDVNVDEIVARTALFSGADLVRLVDDATERAMERAVRSGKVDPVTRSDLRAATKESRPSTTSWFDVAKSYATFADEGGEYDELLDYLKRHKR
ncbi:ATP-binding protein [Patulibacter minatonensis]|uniref:ATP-binding protein n=1 Tax=Patulibacter minatonensis TaxID=298163 RepID=UPI00047B228D|nr:ATP-binding protein [Patulibacter minatonensis]